VLEDLDSSRAIAAATDQLLREADAYGRLPTPVEDIIAAANLRQDDDPLFADHILDGASPELAEKMRRLKGRITAALDRKQRVIYVDDTVSHDGKRRFKQMHEVTHDILPWQRDTAWADSAATLSWKVRNCFEQEANQGGAELLFQRGRFQEMAAGYKVGFGAVLDLAEQFGASYHAAFRRYVETHKHAVAGVVLDRSPCEPGSAAYRRNEALNSAKWMEKYEPACGWPKELRAVPYSFISNIPLLAVHETYHSTFGYVDRNNEQTELQVEMWSNTYNVFVLIWADHREFLKRRRLVAVRSAGSFGGR
jgi:hypothetical protein